ncbi:hypothetical protein [Embleya hyalina]|uniref:Uncharacterized protein n=1 Tax=Embleya hyalina TaxID=516124 RepID=A0A401YZ54_9ACTN|nr:hypothetical protein [Embleya hyalina]GCD99868.1 hypothetical protein EHYA_07590 [Embleya hyalina]
MARNLFGGTPADVAEDIDGRRMSGAVGTAWDGPGETARRITDLAAADGSPLIQLQADHRGMIAPFYGPADDSERLWVDFGVGRLALVSTTVGERLRDHATADDPHRSKAYVNDQISKVLPKTGGVVEAVSETSWLTVTVPPAVAGTADGVGNAWVLRAQDGTGTKDFTRLKNSGALQIDPVGAHLPLAVGSFQTEPGSPLIRGHRGRSGTGGGPVVFEVTTGGDVHAEGAVSASNIGSARVYSGPNPPANPRAGDVWVRYA